MRDPGKQRDDTKKARSGGSVQSVFHTLAKFFNGFHWAIGMTALPDTASPREERGFVFMWLGIIAFLVLFFAVMIRLL